MEPIHILCTLRFTEAQLDKLRAVSPRLVIRQETTGSAEELARLLKPEIEIAYLQESPSAIRHAEKLKWAQLHLAGVNHLIGSPLWQTDVLLTTSSGVHATPIGEYVLGVMLALNLQLRKAIHFQERHEWPKGRWNLFVRHNLRGRKLGIIGYGSIGREVARLGSSLGMEILALRRYEGETRDLGYVRPGTGDPEGKLPSHWYRPAELPALLEVADVVVLALPATTETRGLIGAAELRRMKADVLLINVARGEIVDQEALIRALQQGWIGGAALDTFDPEPLTASNPLWDCANVIITPHVSAYTPDYYETTSDLFAANLRRYLAGEPLLNLVDRQRGY